MKYPAYFFWLCLLVGVNFGIFSNLSFFGAVPNLFLLFVIFSASLKESLFERLFIAFLSGLFVDYWNGGFFGGYTLVFLLLCLVLQALRSAFTLADMDWKYFALILLLSFVLSSLSLWLYNFIAFRLHWTEYYSSFFGLVKKWPAELFYNLVMLYPVKKFFGFVQKLNQRYFEVKSL